MLVKTGSSASVQFVHEIHRFATECLHCTPSWMCKGWHKPCLYIRSVEPSLLVWRISQTRQPFYQECLKVSIGRLRLARLHLPITIPILFWMVDTLLWLSYNHTHPTLNGGHFAVIVKAPPRLFNASSCHSLRLSSPFTIVFIEEVHHICYTSLL